MNYRKNRDILIKIIVSLSTAISVGMLILIIGFIFIKGLPKLSLDYLTRDYNAVTQYIFVNSDETYIEPDKLPEGSIFINKYGIVISEKTTDDKQKVFQVMNVNNNSSVKNALNVANEKYGLKKLDMISKIDGTNVNDINIDEGAALFEKSDALKLKVIRPGGGILPMIITTLELIVLSLLIAIPIGVLAAIYLVEYAKPGRLINVIRFATESLAGIPSIVYGLFGMIFFVKMLAIGQSLMAGSLTLSILLLPTIIRTTEETLKTVPLSYKEASFGLGANRLQTLTKIIFPNAIPGILVAIILSVGRIVGESAALLFTVGTFAKIPSGIKDSGATLTVRAYLEVKEYGNVEMAAGIGVVLIVIVFILNLITRSISRKLTKNNV